MLFPILIEHGSDRLAPSHPRSEPFLAPGESLRLNADIDPLIPAELAPRVVELCLAGADPRKPYASPLYGDLTGLPPTLILVGGDDGLRHDAVRIAEKMRAAGCHVEVEVWPHMWHVWHLLARVMLRQEL